jgi:hypothetical protein
MMSVVKTTDVRKMPWLNRVYIGDVKRDIACDVACLIYLPQTIETILTVSHHPRWPRQVQSGVAVADGFDNEHCQCNDPFVHKLDNYFLVLSIDI